MNDTIRECKAFSDIGQEVGLPITQKETFKSVHSFGGNLTAI